MNLETVQIKTNEVLTELTQRLTQDLQTHQMLSRDMRKKVYGAINCALDQGAPISIFAGSCPDYSHDGEVYTYESLRGGIPLLANIHIQNAQELLKVFVRNGVPFEFRIAIADVEAEDEFFRKRYADREAEDFKAQCASSEEKTQSVLDQTFGQSGITAISTSFFKEFGYENVMGLQATYQQLLQDRYRTDSSFKARVADDVRARMGMYRKLYKGEFEELSSEGRQEYFAYRTMRTMAQYLSLGKLVSQRYQNPLIINHPTRNIGLLNERNKFLLPGDDVNQRKLPVLTLSKNIY